MPDLGGTHPLVAAVGYSRALEICLTARRIDAVEALAIGLATIVVPRASLGGAVADLVPRCCRRRREVAVETKALLLGALGRTGTSRRPPSARPNCAGCAPSPGPPAS